MRERGRHPTHFALTNWILRQAPTGQRVGLLQRDDLVTGAVSPGLLLETQGLAPGSMRERTLNSLKVW